MRKDIDKTNEKFNNLSFSQFKALFPSTENLKLPTAKALKNMDVPILVSLKTEEGILTVYRNGFFMYETENGHVTVYAVDCCARIVMYSARDKPSVALDESSFGDCPWPKVLEFAASERIASNISRNVERHEVLSIDVAPESWDAQMSIGSNFETQIEGEEEKAWKIQVLERAKDILTVHQWKVLWLYYVKSLTQEEISNNLKIPQSDVSITLKRALWRLKKNLANK